MSTSISRFIGIDPSATSSGVAILNGDGNILHHSTILPRELREQERLVFIRDRLKEIVSSLAPCSGMALACIEGPSLKSINKADTLGQVRGVFLVALYDFGFPTIMVPPTVVKKFGTKSGAANKDAMIKTAREHWAVNTPLGDDEADALWLAHIAYSILTSKVETRTQLEIVKSLTEDHKHVRIPGMRSQNM